MGPNSFNVKVLRREAQKAGQRGLTGVGQTRFGPNWCPFLYTGFGHGGVLTDAVLGETTDQPRRGSHRRFLPTDTCGLAIQFSNMTTADLGEALDLWRTAEGVRLSQLDEQDRLGEFLKRNPGLSQIARDEGDLAAAALCGHDGRIGYLHHVAVAPRYRRRGVGRRLVERCLDGLQQIGIDAVYSFVVESNRSGENFWRSLGWHRRDVQVMCLDSIAKHGR